MLYCHTCQHLVMIIFNKGVIMDLYEIRREINNAEQTLKNADEVANDLAYILDGRLKQVNAYRLKRLKHQLKQFNANTGRWK